MSATAGGGWRGLDHPARVRVVGFGLIACAMLALGMTVASLRGSESAAPSTFVELVEPIQLPDVTLTDTDGDPYNLRAEGEGKVTLLYFGYLNCPDACPIHMAVLGRAFDALGAEQRDGLQVVFVTTDPDRDTPAQLRDFLDRFDPSFIGLTGSLDELRSAQVAAGVPVAVAEEPDENGDYLVGHATQVLLFDRDGVASRAYPFGVRQSDWMSDLPELVEGAA